MALLNLSVYERMQQLANQRSSAAKSEAEFIRRQLETDYAGATEEALEQKKAELKTAAACAKQAEAQLNALGEAATLAQQARAQRKEQASLARDHETETKRLVAANATLDGAGHARKTLEAELDQLKAQQDAHGFDEGRHTTLVAARPLAEQLVSLQQGSARAAKVVADKQKDLIENLARPAPPPSHRGGARERSGQDREQQPPRWRLGCADAGPAERSAAD